MSAGIKLKQLIFVSLITLVLLATPLNGFAKTNLKIFHAGSLSIPFQKIESKFEADHPNVNVQLMAYGSVLAVRQVTEVGKKGDIVAVADYSLIPSMMMPDYTNFYLQFAKNRMVIAYNDDSDLSDKINSDNWYNVLGKPQVQFGFSNPNMDPCGYRSPMVMQMAEMHYLDPNILDRLVLENSSIYVEEKDGTYEINTPEALKPKSQKLTIRNKSVDLVAMVQQGGLDYAFEYMSVAKQHGLKFVTLPTSIDLSSTAYADTYDDVKVITSDGKPKTAKPIVYGITVPSNAPNPEIAKEFIKFLIGETGNEIFTELGQPPIVPARGYEDVPEELNDLVEQN